MKEQLKIIILVFICVTTKVIAQKSGISVVSEINRNEMVMGEQMAIRLTVNCNSFDSVIWPVFSDTITAQIELVEKYNIDTQVVSSAGHKVMQQAFVVTTFDTGSMIIPSFTFLVNGQPYQTQEKLIYVQGVKLDTSRSIFDIKPVFRVRYTILEDIVYRLRQNENNFYWGLATYSLLTAGLILFISNMTQVSRRKRAEQFSKPIVPPHILALQRLEKIKELKLWQNTNSKVYYSAISSVIREYIENVYYISALEMTTKEILNFMKKTNAKDNIIHLSNILELADLAKFAKWSPSLEENEKTLNQAFDFVQITHSQLRLTEPEKELHDTNV